jgi:O-antigen ligase
MKVYLRIERTLLLIVILATLLYVPAIMDTFILPKLFIVVAGAGVLSALIIPQFLQFWKNGYRVPMIFSIIFLVSLGFVSLLSEQSFFATLLGSYGRSNGALLYVSLLVVFLSVVFIASEKFYHNLLVTLGSLGLALTIYGFFQIFGLDFVTWAMFKNEAILTFGNPNFSGVFLAFSAIATFYLFIFNSKKLKFFYLASFVAQFYLVMISTAIQGKIIAGVCIFIFIGFILRSNPKKIYRDLGTIWMLLLMAGTTILVIGLSGFGPGARILQSNLNSFKDRTYHWLAAWEMFKSQPIFGVGIDAFRDNYRLYRSEEAIKFRGNTESWTSNAHNLFFQFAATGGLILLLGYIALIGFTLYRYFIAKRNLQNPKLKLLLDGYFALWIAYQLQSFISIDAPSLALWGWMFSGSLIGISYLTEKKSDASIQQKGYAPINSVGLSQRIFLKSMSRQLFSFSVILSLIPAFYVLTQIYFEYDYKKTRKEIIAATSTELVQSKGSQLYEKSLRLNQPELRLDAIVKLLERNLANQALQLAIQTTQEFPKSFGAWNAVASIYEGSNNLEDAIPARKMTIKLDPLNTKLVELLNQDQAQNSTEP